MIDPVFVKRVVLSNFRSIKECSVGLGPLTFLVGPNGSGKSNFVDALRLVAEALQTSLDQALRMRGGVGEVRRRSFGKEGKKGKGRPTNFGVRLEFQLENMIGSYAFAVGAKPNGAYEIQKEECRWSETGPLDKAWYRVENGEVKESSESAMPVASVDQLYLIRASGTPVFRPVFDAFSRMGFYNLNPDAIRELQTPAPGEVLRRDGGNLSSVLALMGKHGQKARKRMLEFLGSVVPGITDVSVRRLGKKETLEFLQEVVPGETIWRFLAENMSDGTLRALGVLTALFQAAFQNGNRVPLVGIEEPETAVHPGAAGVLRDALVFASASTQVLVTSHSPDLLDDKDVKADWIQGVVCEQGETRIGPIDEADRSVLRDRLFTAGELLKRGQLTPDVEKVKRIPTSQLELFVRQTE